MSWHARLQLDLSLEGGRSVARHRHDGPLRILKSLYPEGDAVCHNVLVHPPSGLVGGDTLDIDVAVQAGAHGLVTTPGATRFYRTAGEPARQLLRARVASGARLEWLPLEAIAYNGCRAENRAVFELAPGAELLGWDITALGLPSAGLAFEHGDFAQHLELPGIWLERGRMAATDQRLMDGTLGLAGARCLATLFFASGTAIPRGRREQALEVARSLIDQHPLKVRCGVTAPHPQVLVLRALAPLVEPATDLLRSVWSAWRHSLWGLNASRPRLWAT